ncbi:MAG: globin domain-containing protein [Pseudomonadota bacterium]
MGINIKVIRSSFDLVKPMAPIVADRFYEILFQDYPEAKVFFSKIDMPKQKNALIASLVTAINNLDNPDQLTRFLLNLGESHGRYGVEDQHYQWVGQSLMKSLKQCLSEAWTQDVEYQWAEVYGIMAEAMKAGAKRSKSNVRAIHREATSGAIPPSDAKVDTPQESQWALTDSAKLHIRSLVEEVFDGLIKKEISICIEDYMQNIEKMSLADIIKKAI